MVTRANTHTSERERKSKIVRYRQKIQSAPRAGVNIRCLIWETKPASLRRMRLPQHRKVTRCTLSDRSVDRRRRRANTHPLSNPLNRILVT
uniref:Uncharacterized protein n=1 Tax=Octopus bimaculoides TaxID=37653 RepID=A0A0L8G116_OCTBM